MNRIMEIMMKSKAFRDSLRKPEKDQETHKVTSMPKDVNEGEDFTLEEMELLAEHARNQRNINS